MGKREYALIVVFMLLGVAAYQFAAPGRTGTDGGLSLAGLTDRIRSEMRSHGERVEHRIVERATVTPAITEVAVIGFAGRLTIVGSDSADVVAGLLVGISGLDAADASARAQNVTLSLEPRDGAMEVRLSLPPDMRPSDATLKLDVPERLAARMQVSGGPTQIRRVEAVILDATGDVRIRDIRGGVTGQHRAGDLRVTRIGSLQLTTTNSGIRVEQVTGDLELEASEGRVRARAIGGAVRLEAHGNYVLLDEVEGSIAVRHRDGRLVLDHVRSPVEVVGEHSRVSIRLELARPVRVETTDQPLDIVLPPLAGIDLDATAHDGALNLQGLHLDVRGDDDERRAEGAVDGGGPTITAVVRGADLSVRR